VILFLYIYIFINDCLFPKFEPQTDLYYKWLIKHFSLIRFVAFKLEKYNEVIYEVTQRLNTWWRRGFRIHRNYRLIVILLYNVIYCYILLYLYKNLIVILKSVRHFRCRWECRSFDDVFIEFLSLRLRSI